MRQNGIILLPVDLSDASVPALRFAQAMAASYDARLVLLHVIDEAPAIWRFGWPGHRTTPEPTQSGGDIDAAFVGWVASVCPDGLAHERVVATGGAGAEIIRVARELPADFVVLATHGNTGVQARFMGGTAYQVLRGVRCPVASIKPPGFGSMLLRMWEGIQLFGDNDEAADGVRRDKTFPPAKILHPTDFSEASHNATLVAARMAGHTGAELTVLHVGVDAPDGEDIEEKLEQVRLQVEAMGGGTPRLLRRRGDASSEVLRESIEGSADLIVMGSEGIGGLSVLSVGSTAARVVRQASCPVVTLRADLSLREIDRAFRKVYASLSVATLRAEDEPESMGDIEDMVRSPNSELFLGFYTRAGFVRALEEYGILQALRDRGYEDLHPSFDLSDPFEHVFRIHFGDSGDRDHLLIEASLRPGTIELPNTALDEKVQRFPVLVVLWLCMQNPRGEFSARKPPMPDQAYPGLGLAREMLELFLLIAERLGKEALVNRPMTLHNARYYHHKFRFLDPRMEGRLAAILRDTDNVTLADASWSLYLGCLNDAKTGEALRWEGKEQVFPMSDPLKAYFESSDYRREVWATAADERYEIDWERFKDRASQPG